MYHNVRLALELPGLVATGPAPARRSILRDLVAVAGAAERHGFDALWLSGDTAAGAGLTADPVTLAGGLATRTASLHVGVRAGLVGGRHPSVLARDLTTLDLLSAGRAALCLAVGGSGDTVAEADLGGDPAAALAEAATVCRLVFTDPEPRWSGQVFHIAGAVNRPGPFRGAGPPLLVDLDVLAGEVGPGGECADGALERCLPFVDGTVTTETSPEAVSRFRASVDCVAHAGGIERRSLLWRGRLASRDGFRLELLGALHEAGVDGFIVQVGETPPEGAEGSPLPMPEDVVALAEALKLLAVRWTT